MPKFEKKKYSLLAKKVSFSLLLEGGVLTVSETVNAQIGECKNTLLNK